MSWIEINFFKIKKTFFDSIPTCCVIAASTSTQQNVKNNRDFNQKTYNRFKYEQVVAYPMQLIQLDWNITKLGRLSFFWNININLSPEFRFLQFRWRIPWKRCIQIWKDDSKNCWRCYFFISCILSNMNFNLQNDNSMFHEKILRHIIFFLKLQRIFLNIITWISWVFEGLLLDQIIIYCQKFEWYILIGISISRFVYRIFVELLVILIVGLSSKYNIISQNLSKFFNCFCKIPSINLEISSLVQLIPN